MKERFSKSYRHADLDTKISSQRLSSEVRALSKCRRQTALADVVYTPAVFFVDEEQRRIYMERIFGDTVKEKMHTLDLEDPKQEQIAMQLAAKIGRGIAGVHAAGSVFARAATRLLWDRASLACSGEPSDLTAVALCRCSPRFRCLCDVSIVHGDLTTSNLMLVPTAVDPVLGSLVVIDFGLALVSLMNEDRAVDLYVLERAFLSTHPNSEKVFAGVLEAYQATFKDASKVLSKLNIVRQRGRKRQMVG